MTLTAPSRPSDCRVDGDALAPLLLPEGLALTAEQFAAVCQANPNAVLELNANGQVIHMTPTGSETGARKSNLLMQLVLPHCGPRWLSTKPMAPSWADC